MLKGRKGLTLVEVVLTVLVFASGLISLLAVYIQSREAGRRTDAVYTAYNLAKNHIEQLRSLDYTLLPDAAEMTAVRLDEDGTPDVNGVFLRTTSVDPAYGGNPDLTRASVSVSYLFKGAENPVPIEMTTVIHDT